MVLTEKDIVKLANRPWLSDKEMTDIIDTLLFYMDVNRRQSDLLKASIDQVVELRKRITFYRNVTIKEIKG